MNKKNNTKQLTILHSNDIHGDFMAELEQGTGQLVGGLSLLSAYVQKVRKEVKNVLFVIAGDMVRGSLIDSEYKGISTIEIMNFVAPDVVTLGNHELDYGLAHLLFLEKMANFPIVNANMYIKKYYKRLMKPYEIINIDGLDVMFIGIITEEVLQELRMDSDVGTFIGLEEACREVGKICNAYKNDDIDLTVLLTHIGFENDKRLAGLLDRQWGVDVIIGGHSHTLPEKPEKVNNVLIVQAGCGTDQIGRFDLVIDDNTNSIVDWNWQIVKVCDDQIQPDGELEEYINSYAQTINKEYHTIICRLQRPITHPARTHETEIGDLFADIFFEKANVDLALVCSGSIRQKTLGPVITRGNLKVTYPFPIALYKCMISGRKLRRMFRYYLRNEHRKRNYPFFQVSHGVRIIYNIDDDRIEKVLINGLPLHNNKIYKVVLENYHVVNCSDIFGLSMEELTA